MEKQVKTGNEDVLDNQMSNNKNQIQKQILEGQQEIKQNKQQKSESKDQQVKDKSKNILQQKEINLKQVSYTPAQIQLKKELQSMQFEQILIQQAIQQTNNLQQAIQFIITKIQANEQKQLIGSEANQVKVYFIVRMDLKMGTGKIAAQVGHAALKAFQQMRYSASINDKNAGLLIEWMQSGKKTKILQAETQYEIRGFLDRASQKLINHCNIRDAGRTQIAAGSMTVGAIGPVRQCDVGFLKNLKQL